MGCLTRNIYDKLNYQKFTQKTMKKYVIFLNGIAMPFSFMKVNCKVIFLKKDGKKND